MGRRRDRRVAGDMSSEGRRVAVVGAGGVVAGRASRRVRRRRGVRGLGVKGRGVKGRGVKDFGVVREAGVGLGRSDRHCAGGGVGVFEVVEWMGEGGL